MLDQKLRTPEDRRKEHRKNLEGLQYHVGTFVIINVFFWLLDAWGPGGINWSYIVTVAWGIALSFHALWYFVEGRKVEDV